MGRSHSKDRRRQKRRDRDRRIVGLNRARRIGRLSDEEHQRLIAERK